MAEVNATRACVVCGGLFPRNGKVNVCSDECAVTRNRGYALRNGRIKGPQQLTCAHCNTAFIGRASKVYCSVKCKGAVSRKTVSVDSIERRKKWRKARAGIENEQKRKSRALNPRNREAERTARKLKGYKGEVRPDRPTKKGTPEWLKWKADVAARAAIREADKQAKREARAKAREAIRAMLEAKAKEQNGKPARGQAESSLILKADPVKYAAALTQWRAKSFKRKTGKAMPNDGTVSAVIMFAGRRCLYCNCTLDKSNRTVDHMDPLVLGGVHSASNIAPCCHSCNSGKQGKSFIAYVDGLDHVSRSRAVKFYEKLNGSVQQVSLFMATG